MRLLFPLGMTFLDNNGNPLNGGLIYTSQTGVAFDVTPKATYTDAAGGTPQANPVVLNSYGRLTNPIWLNTDTAYRIVLKTADAATTIVSADNITGMLDPTYEALVSHNLKFATGRGLLDDSGNEQVILTKTSNAVNYLNVTNAATGSGPTLAAAGDDSNADLNLSAKGTGKVNITGAIKPSVSGSFFAYATVGTSCANNTSTEVVCGTELFDDDSWYSTSTGRFTPLIAGYYLICATGGFSTCNAACSIAASIAKNGSLVSSNYIRTEAADKLGIAHISCVVQLNGSTDYVSPFLYQNGGGTETSDVAGTFYQTFSGHLIAAT